MRKLQILILVCFWSSLLMGQTINPVAWKKVAHIEFFSSDPTILGFDAYNEDKNLNDYEKIILARNASYPVPFMSVKPNDQVRIMAIIRNFKGFEVENLRFIINDSSLSLPFARENDSLLTFLIPSSVEDFSITARYRGRLFGKLNVSIFDEISEQLTIVSLLDQPIDKESLSNYLNSVFSPANIKINIRRINYFNDSIFSPTALLNNPSPHNDRYTEQMRELRDAYFEKVPQAPKNTYYIFIVPGFVNEKIDGYMARNKAMGFIKHNVDSTMFRSIARELGHGIGMLQHYWLDSSKKKGTTENLMDSGHGTVLTKKQWEELRHSSNSFAFYDPDEDIKTNNGMVAYYFWQEDGQGRILLNGQHPLSTISRPFKKNYLSYHLNIEDVLFKIVWQFRSIVITYWNIIIWSVLLIAWILVRYFIRRHRKRKNLSNPLILRWGINSAFVVLILLSNEAILSYLKHYQVTSGLIEGFYNKDMSYVRKNILNNINLDYEDENELSSEIMLQKGKNWYMKRRKKVLYFDVHKDSTGQYSWCKFVTDKDSLVLSDHHYRDKAESHYLVFNFYDHRDSLVEQKAFNHLGIEISDKLEIDDAAKRILLFVNGYRPTSVGHTFEDNFKDIRENGLEFLQTSNLIYTFDRFNYWSPWQNIDAKFKKRINPNDVYYADGHFSVSTSNYESLLNFTRITAQYPKRCRNPKGHTCFKTKVPSTGFLGNKEIDTYDFLPTKPNKQGFKERKRNGRLAGKNLSMMFNEIPNRSDNDTLYIIAHSMGYAYALGIIEELRGKIHFGGFYIIAPENASSGKVNLKEWKEVWQYGSKWNKFEKDAPCLQDGVAPQTCAAGLEETNRAYIPANQFRRKGFFDSHFVGYYSWIFQLDPSDKGYIRQR